jgi:hypothetical protein
VIRSIPDSSEVAAVRHTAWPAERAGTTPWRMTAADYSAAVSERRGEPSALGLVVPETPWDPALHGAMHNAGSPAHEEELRRDLLASMT